MKAPKTTKILITQDAIRNYIESSRNQSVSQAMFREYVDLGLPVIKIRGKSHAHADNIDEFFRNLTGKSDA